MTFSCEKTAYSSENVHHETFCLTCGEIVQVKRKYCNACHAANMRKWRKTHPLTPEQRVKDNARSFANVYKRRGKIEPEPCKVCGDKHAEMHHPDYNRPLWVQWLCRPCHLSLHRLVVQEYDAEKLKDAVLEQRRLIAFLKQEAA